MVLQNRSLNRHEKQLLGCITVIFKDSAIWYGRGTYYLVCFVFPPVTRFIFALLIYAE